MLKITIVTVAYNAEETIADSMRSVLAQSHLDLEYIIIDGLSTDSTMAIVGSFADPRIQVVSEKDNGIYDAMNKGIGLATGDVIGILNSDDFYTDENVLQRVEYALLESGSDCVFGDVRFVKSSALDKTVRYYSSAGFNIRKFKYGFMPAHPTFFTYRRNFSKYGHYKTDYRISADYELVMRFLYTNALSFSYIPGAMITMRLGGESTRSIRSNITLNREIVRACAENGVKTSMWLLALKYFVKLKELIFTRN